jgi:hypothetical protein
MMQQHVVWRRNALQILALVAFSSLVLSACETIKNPFPRKSNPPAELGASEPAPSPAPAQGVEAAPVPQGLALSSQQRFSDIPLPQGVKEDSEKTFVYEDKALQVGRMVYTTRSSVNDLANFYIRECPAADWQLQNVIQADGAELLFSKPSKRLKIVIRNHGTTAGRELILTMTPESPK